MKKCQLISFKELETLQVKNELINNRKSEGLLQIKECCHEDFGKGLPQNIGMVISHEHFSFRRQNLANIQAEKSQ